MVVTNALGAAFTAALLSASDAGATFVFPEDGATNVLAWSQLSEASREAVGRAADFTPVPPRLAATVQMARDEYRRLADLEADERLAKPAAAELRGRLRRTFLKACRKRGADEDLAVRLWNRVVAER